MKAPIDPRETQAAGMPRIHLGTIDLPSGVLLMLDPGLARYWSHDQVPLLTRFGNQTDFAFKGPDAPAAAAAFDRQFDPGYLFDIPEKGIPKIQELFEQCCKEHGCDAGLEPLPSQMPHLQRAHSAIVVGGGMGIVQYAGVWGVVVDGFEPGEKLDLFATPMPAGEFEGRWQRLELCRSITTEIVACEEIEGVMVDYGQFAFSDLQAFGSFRMWESLDGLGDFVFWGKDAAILAAETGAQDLGDGHFGWKDLPMDELNKLARKATDLAEERKLKIDHDYRPHCNLEKLNAQVRGGEARAGLVELDGSVVIGLDNRWGDGIFAVRRDLDADGKVVRICMELGTEKRQKLVRAVRLRSCFAVVSLRITRDAEPVRSAIREEADDSADSGWVFFSGDESDDEINDSKNFTIRSLGAVIDADKALSICLDLPVGSWIRREGDHFVVDDS